jgi:hypothetical protein
MPPTTPLVCPTCHQPILPTYYFCPNCGTKLNSAPLSTTPQAQAMLYAFSLILPVICFLMIGKWQGWKYYRSTDPKTKSIGTTAIVLMVLSTIVTVWLASIWVNGAIQSSLASVNSDMSGI